MNRREQRDKRYRDVFRREYEILDFASELERNEQASPEELKEGLASLEKGFRRLLEMASKMTRIGDSVQSQLMDVQRELRKALREKEELNQHLTAMSEEKDEYLGFAAHDLRNPLSNVIMGLEMMKDHPEMSRDEWTDIVDDSTEECSRMLELLSNLLDVNRIETGSMAWEKREFCASESASLVVEKFSAKSRRKDQKIDFQESQDDIMAYGDPQGYIQILENLLSNALKYSPPGTCTKLRVFYEGDYLRTEVEDRGPGLTSEDQERLFGKFARLSARPTAGESSVGLGLSIVKSLTESMKGRVGCRTRLGEGSIFYFDIPAQAQ